MDWYGARPERYGVPSPSGGPVAPGCRETLDPPVRIDNELYVRDYARCILCYKCVEACGEEAQNTFAIAVSGRGFDARISTEFDAPLGNSACVYCGNCVAVCPTGALLGKTEYDLREAGAWDPSRQTPVDTICPYCGVGCTLRLWIQDNRIVKADSPPDHDITRGNLCIKGRFGWKFVEGPGPSS
jgi:predicted molibdopterin-dependent oxidoreductase YjgC